MSKKDESRGYPYSLTLIVWCGDNPKNACKIRDKVAEFWKKTGDWSGQGHDIRTGEFDLTVDFPSKEHIAKAKEIAHGVLGRVPQVGHRFREVPGVNDVDAENLWRTSKTSKYPIPLFGYEPYFTRTILPKSTYPKGLRRKLRKCKI